MNMQNRQKMRDKDENATQLHYHCLTEIIMAESLGSVVTDTAGTRTVYGEKWLDHYASGLTQSALLKMKDIKSAGLAMGELEVKL